MNLRIVFCLTLVPCFFVCAKSQVNFGFDTCSAYGNVAGECINVKRCDYVLELLQSNPSDEVKADLAATRCGFEGRVPMVCCPIKFKQWPQGNPYETQPVQVAGPKSSVSENHVKRLPEPGECGVAGVLTPLRRIIGGVPALLGQYPWAVLLAYKTRGGNRFKCGGTLVTRRHVVTAAHCITKSLEAVRVGELDYEDPNDGATPVDISIKKMIPHEQYREGGRIVNDIAVLVLGQDVRFTELIRPLCLPTSANLRWQNFDRYTPWVAGWGVTQHGIASSHLLSIQLPVFNIQECASVYANDGQVLIDDRVICVGYANVPGKDSCSGDSGGPLMTTSYHNESRSYPNYLIGVVSFGPKKCGTAGLPGVYTRVNQFLPWLYDKILGVPFN